MNTRRVWSIGQIICSKRFPNFLPHAEHLIDEFLIECLDQKVLIDACERGAPVEDLEFILLRTAPNWRKVVKSAARGGHLHVFQWMTDREDGRGPWREDFKGCYSAAGYGHLEVVKWYWNRGIDRDGKFTACEAAHNGQLAILQWVWSHRRQGQNLLQLANTAEGNHLDTIEWSFVIENDNILKVEVQHTIERAARSGHLHILKWIYENSSARSKLAMNVAVAAGHVEIAQWLLENDNEEWSVTSVADAAANADLRIIQWLHEHFHDLFDCKVMDEAAGGGHLDVVRWLHQNRSEGCSCGAMDLAAKNGHLDVVQWLHDNRKEGCTAMALLDAAANGHLDVVKFLVVNERETTWTLNAFEEAVLRGQLHVVKWLHDYCKARCSTDTITVSAWMGYLDTVCYLSEKDRKLSESIPGLHEAATQGNMEVLAFLMNHEFGEDKRIDNLEIYAFGVFEAAWVSNHFNTVLNQFRDQQKRVYSVKRIVEFLERFHADGFHVCVCIMLGLALQRGCIAMAKRFFDRRTNQEMAAYMVTAGESQGFYAKSIDVMLRWLIDNRVSLNISNDRNLVLECCVLHEDIAARFSESDRVVLIGEVIKDNEFLQFDLGLWILENTSFKEETIRVAIRATIRQSSRFSQWLTLRLTNEEVRNWCLSDT